MSTANLASPDKKSIQEFFDGIAPRYDFLNNFLSFNLDENWRKKAKKIILQGNERSILDLGVGTGKFLQTFLKEKSWDSAVGLDFSNQMLLRAQEELPKDVRLLSGDFHDLPFAGNSFDLIVSGFTLRSVKDMPQFLSEVYRILNTGGKVAFLCLTRPRNKLFKLLYYPYLKFYLPCCGNMVSGHAQAYKFLSDSIQSFQEPIETMKMMTDEGFGETNSYEFTFGAATLIVGKK